MVILYIKYTNDCVFAEKTVAEEINYLANLKNQI